MKLRRFLAVLLLTASALHAQVYEVSFPRLANWYSSYNMQYFDDGLPRDTELVYGPLKDAMGETTRVGGRFRITIDKRWAPAEVTQEATLLHEMCHVETWTELDKHGPRWRTCVKRLQIAGAFDDLL